MAMIGVRIAVLGLALAALCLSSQACAFGLRLGPFLLGWRAHHHHHRHLVRRPPRGGSIPKLRPLMVHKIARQAYSNLSCPGLCLPMIFSGRPTIALGRSATKAFSARPSPEYPAKRVADLCTRQIGKSDAILRIGREIAPIAAQQPLLQKLGTALAQANGYLIKSCPTEFTPPPVERLQLSGLADRRDDYGARDRPRPLAEIRAIVPDRQTACTALCPRGERRFYASLREKPGASELAHADPQAGPATYHLSRGCTK